MRHIYLLQCQHLPPNIVAERARLIDDYFPGMPIPTFARSVIDCVGADIVDPGISPCTPTDPVLCFLCKGLALGRKILRHARKTHATLYPAEEPERGDTQPDVSQLFRPVEEHSTNLQAGRPAAVPEEPERGDSQPDVSQLLSQLSRPVEERPASVRVDRPATLTRLAPTCSLQYLAR